MLLASTKKSSEEYAKVDGRMNNIIFKHKTLCLKNVENYQSFFETESNLERKNLKLSSFFWKFFKIEFKFEEGNRSLEFTWTFPSEDNPNWNRQPVKNTNENKHRATTRKKERQKDKERQRQTHRKMITKGQKNKSEQI